MILGISGGAASYDKSKLVRATVTLAMLLLLATPTFMVATREIPATMLVIVTVLLTLGVIAAGQAWDVLHDLSARSRTLLGVSTICLVVLAALSVVWSPAPTRGATHALHFGGSLFATAVAVAVMLRLRLQFSGRTLALALGAAALLTVVDIAAGSPVRVALSLPAPPHLLNRTAVALALFLPLVTVMLVAEQRFLSLAMVWVGGLAAIALSISNSAQLGIMIGILVLVPALLAPRIVHAVVAIGTVSVFLAMPLIGPIANDIVPERVHEAVGYSSLGVRGEIWRETAAFIWERPILGWGLEASHIMASLPQAAELTQTQRDLLNHSHPHNAPLQIWLELGLVGAVTAALALAAGFHALTALPRVMLPHATASAASAFAIACVSHGAWQAWWWGLLGLLVIAYAAQVIMLCQREQNATDWGKDMSAASPSGEAGSRGSVGLKPLPNPPKG